MKATIINIGNYKGIILPADVIEELNISSRSEVDISIENGALIIRPQPRLGWEESFISAIEKEPKLEGDFFEGMENKFDQEEWQW